jgi:hypothetical protein
LTFRSLFAILILQFLSDFLWEIDVQSKAVEAGMKVEVRMVVFASFEEIAPYLEHSQPVPPSPPEGVHLVTMYDDRSSPQHMMVVVIGDIEQRWQVTDRWPANSPYDRSREIITVEFELDEVPLYVEGERILRTPGQGGLPIWEVHSLHSPRCHCISLKRA